MSHSGSCIFCQVIEGKIPAAKLYEDDNYICIRDIRPQAKVHLLVIPKKHIPTLADAFPEKGSAEVDLVGGMFRVATHIAREQNLLPGGFRSVINTHEQAGQTVFHIHLHLLGGEALRGTFA
jgi:histidine triad (HIT) family protein